MMKTYENTVAHMQCKVWPSSILESGEVGDEQSTRICLPLQIGVLFLKP